MSPLGMPARIVLLALSLAGLFLLWRYGLHGAAAAIAGVAALLFGRATRTSKLHKNPFGENRDYTLRPVAMAAAKAFGCFAVGMLWVVLLGLAVRYKYIPDNEWTAYGLLAAPLVVLTGLGGFYLAKAIFRVQFGGKKSPQ